MSRLHQNCLPADLGVGCTFAERMESAAKVVLNGGVISGSPVFSARGKAQFNGTDTKITYDTVLGVKTVSFWLTLATLAEDLIELSAAHSIEVTAGTLSATGFAAPTIYVNGVATATITTERSHVQITTATAFDADAFVVGKDVSWGEFGIEDLKIYDTVLTARDAYNDYRGLSYGFRNRAVFDLPMTAACHDVANTRTLDVSGNNNHAVWTPGATAPTKGDRRGYYWDSGDHMIVSATGIFNQPEVGIVMEFTPHFPTDLNASCFIFDSTTGSRYFAEKRANAAANVLRIYLGNTQVAIIAEATYKPYWRQGERNLLVVSGESGATDVWLNEGLILEADNSAWTAKDPVNLVIGANQGTANRFLGDIHSMMIFDKLITPRMAADLRHNRINSIGEV